MSSFPPSKLIVSLALVRALSRSPTTVIYTGFHTSRFQSHGPWAWRAASAPGERSLREGD